MKILIVSPHRDDAAFSCAISIRKLVRTGSIAIANCFTVSRYAPFAQVDGGAVSQLRLEEDQNFAQKAGVDLRDLELVDAPERLTIETTDVLSGRSFSDQDCGTIEQIRQHVKDCTPDIVFVPLAIGDHIDHRIAQHAAVKAGIDRLAFYEDLPYSARIEAPDVVQRAASLNLALEPMVIQAPDGQRWKRECAGLYPSQVSGETMEEISRFSRRYGAGERLWVTRSAAHLLREC